MIRLGAANSLADLKVLAEAGAEEVLLGSRDLSRYGNIETELLISFAHEAKKLGLRPILEWDILMTQPEFEKAAALIKTIALGEFDALRVQDPGALEYILTNRPQDSIHLVLETGNQNLEAVLGWCRYGGSQIKRVMLSSQIPAPQLADWIKKIPVPVEVLGLGPVLILYTPRHLLSNQLPETEAAEVLRATASSEESFHSGFRVIENRHGTFVFLGKDYCLMEKIDELSGLGLAAIRIDLRHSEDSGILTKTSRLFSSALNSLTASRILKNYQHATTRCFYKANNTDKSFTKLKNKNLVRRDVGFIGEVVESVKDGYLVVRVQSQKHKLARGQKICLINPQGNEQTVAVQSLRNLDLEEVNETACGDFGVIPYMRLCPAKSSVYSADEALS